MNPSSDKPSVGRIVHYLSLGTPIRDDGTQQFESECRAAIITEVAGDTMIVGLSVHNPTGLFFQRGVTYDDALEQGGTWHWPERLEPEPEFELNVTDLRTDVQRNNAGVISVTVTHVPTGLSAIELTPRSALDGKTRAINALTKMVAAYGAMNE